MISVIYDLLEKLQKIYTGSSYNMYNHNLFGRSFSLIFAEIGLIKELLIVIHKASKRLFLKIVLFFKSFRIFSYALLRTKKTRFN